MGKLGRSIEERMNEVLCSASEWTEPLCLHFFHPRYTGLPVRSWSEAGSGCVRRSADPVQSSFSGSPLGPVQYNSISNSPLLLGSATPL